MPLITRLSSTRALHVDNSLKPSAPRLHWLDGRLQLAGDVSIRGGGRRREAPSRPRLGQTTTLPLSTSIVDARRTSRPPPIVNSTSIVYGAESGVPPNALNTRIAALAVSARLRASSLLATNNCRLASSASVSGIPPAR